MDNTVNTVTVSTYLKNQNVTVTLGLEKYIKEKKQNRSVIKMKGERKIIKELKAGNVRIDKIKRSGHSAIHLFTDVFYHEEIKQIEQIITTHGKNWYVNLENKYVSIHE